MATVRLISDAQASAEVREIFDDIRKVRNTDFINNFWRALANNPAELKRTWAELQQVMGPGSIDPLTKEMIYIAVSVANACTYCIHSHTASARAKGMTVDQHAELLSIVAMAGKTNHLVTAMGVPVDDAFDEKP